MPSLPPHAGKFSHIDVVSHAHNFDYSFECLAQALVRYYRNVVALWRRIRPRSCGALPVPLHGPEHGVEGEGKPVLHNLIHRQRAHTRVYRAATTTITIFYCDIQGNPRHKRNTHTPTNTNSAVHVRTERSRFVRETRSYCYYKTGGGGSCAKPALTG